MKKSILILFTAALMACNTNTAVTDNEIKAVDKVLDFYGGVCHRYKGFSTANEVKQTFFELEMSQSKLIESYFKKPEIPASNIAFLFFKNLENEQQKYTHIHVKINLNNGQMHEYKFSTADLKKIEGIYSVLLLVADKLKSQKYKELLSQFDPEAVHALTVDQISSYSKHQDSLYGKIQEAQFQGFAFSNPKTDRSAAQLMGVLVREKKNQPLSVLVGLKKKKVEGFIFSF